MTTKKPRASNMLTSVPISKKEMCKFRSLNDWSLFIQQRAKRIKPQTPAHQVQILRQGIELLSTNPPFKQMPNSLHGQPFDLHLLALSRLYRKSRQFFLKTNGSFLPGLISSPRTLSSPNLLHSTIEYSPIEQELIWAATDPIQKKSPQYLLTLRTYSTSIFHEQSHRILWRLLPAAPKNLHQLRRYLNFVESLVITMDMALGDELGHSLASLFHICGVTYDPGTDIRKVTPSQRAYRNYLHAANHATFLNLEGYERDDIFKAIKILFPTLGAIGERAVVRSTRLDRQFVENTNPSWQKKHSASVIELLSHPHQEALELSEDPLDNRVQYLWTEKWLEYMSI